MVNCFIFFFNFKEYSSENFGTKIEVWDESVVAMIVFKLKCVAYLDEIISLQLYS